MVKPKLNINESATASEVVTEIMRLFEQFFDVQIEEDLQADGEAAGGENENLGSDLRKNRDVLLKKLAQLNKQNLETLVGILTEKTAGLVEQGNTQVAELMAKVRSEIDRVQTKLTAQQTPQSKTRPYEQSSDSQVKSENPEQAE